jgi:ribosomal protein L16 Arg81 hydroxylase
MKKGTSITAIGEDSRMKITRVSDISQEKFVSEYLAKNVPVVVTDGIKNWPGRRLWTPELFMERFGDRKVQIYDDLFRLISRKTLRQYLEQYFGKKADQHSNTLVPYVRWYTRFKDDHRIPWADDIFSEIKDEWSLPYCLPNSGYLMPFSGSSEKMFPNRSSFPARGLFISPRGGRTRLHCDPWCSDAILCQIYGRKRIIMYSPEQARYLVSNGHFADPDNVDHEKFPNFEDATSTYDDCLEKGEIILIPSRWLHHVITLEDSISLTWNFVHISTWETFAEYLMSSPAQNEADTIRYFIHKTPAMEALHQTQES